jgi:L-rhamnono-1,4-lactonase
MLDEKFIEGVKLLGRRGFTFDVGVDQHRRGKKQLEEVVEFVDRVHDGVPDEEKVTLILSSSTLLFPLS